MLSLIGIGLGGVKDISVKGLELVKEAEAVYLEGYTSLLQCPFQDLEQFYHKKIAVLKRQEVEDKLDVLLTEAKEKNVALLIIGDVFAATTHLMILERAAELGVNVGIVHNASILTAVGATGLSLYNFGKVASIPFYSENVETPYRILKENQGMHTLFLLDLKDGKTMAASDAVKYLLKMEREKKEGIFSEDTLCVVCAALGNEKQKILFCKAKEVPLLQVYPQCLIVPGRMQFFEEEFLQKFYLL